VAAPGKASPRCSINPKTLTHSAPHCERRWIGCFIVPGTSCRRSINLKAIALTGCPYDDSRDDYFNKPLSVRKLRQIPAVGAESLSPSLALVAALAFVDDHVFDAASPESWRARVPSLFRDLSRLLLIIVGGEYCLLAGMGEKSRRGGSCIRCFVNHFGVSTARTAWQPGFGCHAESD
jgi:hypothetical protein